jgi:catechol 2,3-dioxygenase-like lactoylglutathione lyase family enzyme
VQHVTFGSATEPGVIPCRDVRLRPCRSDGQLGEMHLELISVIVRDYDEAIAFFVHNLQFDLVEDAPAYTNDGRPKRWVVVRPPGAITGLLLAQADGDEQRSAVGRQHAGRVGFFLRVDDFDAAYERMRSAGIEFLTEPRAEPYGRVAVFRDVAGNHWDLLGAPA